MRCTLLSHPAARAALACLGLVATFACGEGGRDGSMRRAASRAALSVARVGPSDFTVQSAVYAVQSADLAPITLVQLWSVADACRTVLPHLQAAPGDLPAGSAFVQLELLTLRAGALVPAELGPYPVAPAGATGATLPATGRVAAGMAVAAGSPPTLTFARGGTITLGVDAERHTVGLDITFDGPRGPQRLAGSVVVEPCPALLQATPQALDDHDNDSDGGGGRDDFDL